MRREGSRAGCLLLVLDGQLDETRSREGFPAKSSARIISTAREFSRLDGSVGAARAMDGPGRAGSLAEPDGLSGHRA